LAFLPFASSALRYLCSCAADTSRSLPGDFGFDPWNLGEDKEQLKWYVQVRGRVAELV
jgi:hypothetical protein